jgi:hypothetical protein
MRKLFLKVCIFFISLFLFESCKENEKVISKCSDFVLPTQWDENNLVENEIVPNYSIMFPNKFYEIDTVATDEPKEYRTSTLEDSCSYSPFANRPDWSYSELRQKHDPHHMNSLRFRELYNVLKKDTVRPQFCEGNSYNYSDTLYTKEGIKAIYEYYKSDDSYFTQLDGSKTKDSSCEDYWGRVVYEDEANGKYFVFETLCSDNLQNDMKKIIISFKRKKND